jgi:SdpC family antimicrobial peptide
MIYFVLNQLIPKKYERRGLVLKKIITSLMALALIFGVTFTNIATTEAQAKDNLTNYSGEELFKGIFLGQGEVAKHIPELPKKKEANSQEAIKFGNDLTKKVRDKDGKYFDELKKAVYSNNPKRVSESLEKGATLISSEITKMEGFNIDKVPNPDEATGQCLAFVWAVGLLVVYYAGAAVQVVGAAAYVLEAGVYFTTATVQTQYTAAASDVANSSLTKEIFVKSIVKNL